MAISIRASATSNLVNCDLALHLTRCGTKLAKLETSFAEKGTASHFSLFSYFISRLPEGKIVKSACDELQKEARRLKEVNDGSIELSIKDAEDLFALEAYAKILPEGTEYYIEEKYATVLEDGTLLEGHIDIMFRLPDRPCHIVDLKTGHVQVEPNATQLIAYALLCASTVQGFKIEGSKVAVLQKGRISWFYDLDNAIQNLKTALVRQISKTPTRGNHCQYCPFKLECSATQSDLQRLLTIMEEYKAGNAKQSDLAWIVLNSTRLTNLVKTIEAIKKQESILAGKSVVEGLELIESTRNTIDQTEDNIAKAKLLGLTSTKPLSMTGLISRFGRQLIGQYIDVVSKPSNKNHWLEDEDFEECEEQEDNC